MRIQPGLNFSTDTCPDVTPEGVPHRHSWVWDDGMMVGNSELPFDDEHRHELPAFDPSLLPAMYSPRAHVTMANRLYATTLHAQQNTLNASPEMLDYWKVNYHIVSSNPDACRRAFYIQSCQRKFGPTEAMPVVEHRMMTAIARESSDTLSADLTGRLEGMRGVLQANRLTAAMVEKQLEDFGLLAAPDYRTCLFDIETVGKLSATILQLRFGPGMTQQQAQLHVQAYRDAYIEQAQAAGELDERPMPERPARPHAGRDIAADALNGGGAAAMMWALPLGVLTGGLPLLLGGGLALMLSHNMNVAYHNDMQAHLADPAPPQPAYERRWAAMWRADKHLLTDALTGRLQQVRDGAYEVVPRTEWARPGFGGAPFRSWTEAGARENVRLMAEWRPQ